MASRNHSEKCSDTDFIELVQKHGVTKAASILDVGRKAVNFRRRRLERILKIVIKVPSLRPGQGDGKAPQRTWKITHQDEK